MVIRLMTMYQAMLILHQLGIHLLTQLQELQLMEYLCIVELLQLMWMPFSLRYGVRWVALLSLKQLMFVWELKILQLICTIIGCYQHVSMISLMLLRIKHVLIMLIAVLILLITHLIYMEVELKTKLFLELLRMDMSFQDHIGKVETNILVATQMYVTEQRFPMQTKDNMPTS